MTKTIEPPSVLWLECDCHSEVLRVEYDAAFWTDGTGEYILSIYREGLAARKPTWKYRLRSIWKILRTGEPHHDCIVFKKETMAILGEFISKQQSK